MKVNNTILQTNEQDYEIEIKSSCENYEYYMLRFDSNAADKSSFSFITSFFNKRVKPSTLKA